YGIVFDATQPFTINSVDIYPTNTSASGTMTVVLADNNGTILQTAGPFTVPVGTGTSIPSATAVAIPLNIDVPAAGTGYRLYTTNITTALIRENAGLAFPYPISSYGEITGGWANGNANTTTYYYFYNWEITSGCEGPRQAVAATIHPTHIVDIGNDTTICDG